MNRFGPPDNGEKKNLPWESFHGNDTPELNRDVPAFLLDDIRERHASNFHSNTIDEEKVFLEGLDLFPFQISEIRKQLDAYASGDFATAPLKPNHTLRHELANDLKLLSELSIVFSDYHLNSATLVESYLRGKYRPDPAARNRLVSRIKPLYKRVGKDYDEARDFPLDEYYQYIREICSQNAKREDARDGTK